MATQDEVPTSIRTIQDTMVKVRPNTKEPGCRSLDQHLEVVLPDGQILPHVTAIQLNQSIDELTSITVTLHCGGLLPAKED